MNKTGKTVLWFLAGCMAFTETAFTITAEISDVKSEWVLAFSLLSLIAILTALVIMYTRDPVFLLAESQDVALLSLIKSLANQNSPELFKQLIEKFTMSSLQGEEGGEEDEEGDEPEEGAEKIPEEEVDDETVHDGGEPEENGEEIPDDEVDEETLPDGDGEDDNEYNQFLENLSKGISGGTN